MQFDNRFIGTVVSFDAAFGTIVATLLYIMFVAPTDVVSLQFPQDVSVFIWIFAETIVKIVGWFVIALAAGVFSKIATSIARRVVPRQRSRFFLVRKTPPGGEAGNRGEEASLIPPLFSFYCIIH